MKILIIKNKDVKDGFIEEQTEYMTEYFSEDAPEEFGVSSRQFEFETIETEIDIEFVKVGTNTAGQEAYGADNIKRHIYDLVPEGVYHAVFFIYDGKTIFEKDKYNAPFTYTKNLYTKTPMVQCPDNVDERVLTHEWMHVEEKVYAAMGIIVEEQMDKTLVDGEWIPYYKNSFPLTQGGNFNVSLDIFEPYVYKLEDLFKEEVLEEITEEITMSNYLALENMVTKDNIPQYIFVHHTGGTDDNPLEDTSNHTFEIIQDWHINGKLWQNIGYHYVIEKDGKVTAGRPETYHGAHAYGYNQKSVGIVLAGNFDSTLPTQAQEDALAGLLDEVATRWTIPNERIKPHRHVADKTCYGSKLSDDWALNLMLEYRETLEEEEVIVVDDEPVVVEETVTETESIWSLIVKLIMAIFNRK